MDTAWTLHGYCMDRSTTGTLQGQCMDSAGTLHRHCTDTTGTLHGQKHCRATHTAGSASLQGQQHCRAAAANPAGLVPMASVEALCALTSVSSRENLSNLSLNAKIMKYQQAG